MGAGTAALLRLGLCNLFMCRLQRSDVSDLDLGRLRAVAGGLHAAGFLQTVDQGQGPERCRGRGRVEVDQESVYGEEDNGLWAAKASREMSRIRRTFSNANAREGREQP